MPWCVEPGGRIPSLKDRSQVSMVARNCARHLCPIVSKTGRLCPPRGYILGPVGIVWEHF